MTDEQKQLQKTIEELDHSYRLNPDAVVITQEEMDRKLNEAFTNGAMDAVCGGVIRGREFPFAEAQHYTIGCPDCGRVYAAGCLPCEVAEDDDDAVAAWGSFHAGVFADIFRGLLIGAPVQIVKVGNWKMDGGLCECMQARQLT
ncbi:hypothetical protein BVY04_03925 [bacterium M21]|nr:hypothetical protein BVY04_03925 [bacterium M21]